MAVHGPLRGRAVVLASATVIVLTALVGATYQGVATSLERHRFERPGGLASTGDYQLHIFCVAEGSPVVVLEAAAGALSAAWGHVQAHVARTTRTCSYDRAGLGWSEGDGQYVPARVPVDLRTLLDQAGVREPVVLVGHELGAVFARSFATRYPSDTAALVLVDDPERITPPPIPGMVAAWPWLARVGLLRAFGSLSTHATGLPEPSGGAMRAFLHRPDHLTQAARELANRDAVVTAGRALRTDPAIPVTIVSVGVSRQPAMLTTASEAARVTRAIEAAVRDVRAGRAGATAEP